MIYRAVADADWDQMGDLAVKFYEEKPIPGQIDRRIWISNWSKWVAADVAVIWVAEDNKIIRGAVGGIQTQDPSTNEWMMVEAFWFVEPENRGCGVKLLLKWIAVAKARQCKRLTMVHLSDLDSKRVGTLYLRLGMKPLETHYWKNI